MKYIIIGTAGHVDHGKSALIKALTGKDTDRLKEEKQRGISIDLGFASLPLSADICAGIVDVPGHERFLKNMLAGTGGIDMAMLVIAADEGVMPQTREHLAMLQLLGIESGIVVINKVDKVEADWLELVEEDIKSFLQDTSWKQAPVCRVSAITGQGLEELRQMLERVGAGVSARDSRAPFRLWIDRSFSVKGHGVVVTGSVMSGSASIGDSLCLYPEHRLARIRGLETHGSKVNIIYAGQRAAINITGVEQEAITRGMSLSAPNCSQNSLVWDISMNWQQEVPNGTRVRLHLGTGEFLGRLHQFKNAPAAYMRLILEEPLCAAAGDKGIVRLYSPQHLLGGAVLIAPGTNSRRLMDSRRLLADDIENNDYHSMAEHILAEAVLPVAADVVRRRLGYVFADTVDCALARAVKNEKIQKIDSFYIARQSLRDLDSKLAVLLGTYHRQYSDRPGLSCQVIRQKLNLEEKAFDALVVHWLQSGLIAVTGGEMALKEHAAKHTVWQQDVRSKAEQALSDTDITDIDANLLAEKMSLNPAEAKAAFDALVRGGVLLKVADMHVYRKTMQYIIGLLQIYFQNNPTVTVAELRTLLNTSRKMAIPLLEYLDMNKYTIREGDVRRPSQKIRDFSE